MLYKGKIIIVDTSSLKEALLQEFHCTKMSGHASTLKTFMWVSLNFWWRGLKRDVKAFVAKCPTCQQVKYCTTPPAGLLQPLPIPSHVWKDITIDFIMGLSTLKGLTTIMVIVDRLTKFARFGVLPAEKFTDMVIKLYNFPKTIVSNCDLIFLNQFWHHLFKCSGTMLNRFTPYHPLTDGKSKVVNRVLKQYLRCFTNDKPQ